ncbi:MAG: FtsP/CotA-like multicopper oxidase with cupredoxin domain [Saprospiraceae bacterium]|jgi:FtsP/CotA-like multicopper oxidase with cupredoxin domain
MKFLWLKTAVLILFATPAFSQFFSDTLLIPDTLSGNTFDLNMSGGTKQFYTGTTTNTSGYNGSYLGPTLIFNNGDSVQMHVTNNLNETTTTHWHGMHVAAENDGGPHTSFAPGETWSPKFKIIEKATTFWYHPHVHKKTNSQVSSGLAGLIIIRDDEEKALVLPRTYGVDDIPLVFQTKAFDSLNQITIGPIDSATMVNGIIKPVFNAPAQMVRFRLLNASSSRTFMLGFDDNRSFYQIASDGGLLSAPYSTNRIRLAPGERVEMVVDFNSDMGKLLKLKSYSSELPSSIKGGFAFDGNPLSGANFDFMAINVVSSTPNPVTTAPPSVLATLSYLDENDANRTRVQRLTGRPPEEAYGFNGKVMDMSVIDDTVHINDTEIWEIFNETDIAHPFHLHAVQFFILDRDGASPSANEAGRKDVVLVMPHERVRIIAKFDHFANDSIPYMYHCHMLKHEDDGMMAQFIVVDNTVTSSSKIDNIQQFSIHPNPSTGIIQIETDCDNWNFAIIDKLGRTLIHGTQNQNSKPLTELNLSFLIPGSYFVKIWSQNQKFTEQLIIMR